MMDSNKGEALRCVGIAKEAIAFGNKDRALRFIKIAKRLDPNLPVDELMIACDKLNSGRDESKVVDADSKRDEGSNWVRDYEDEVVERIKQSKDYYAVLGVEKTCSGEDIKRAYRKLSLKVHPDKNKASGSEEAFKNLSKAFKCLSEEKSRRQYDQTGFIRESRRGDRYNVRQWRRRRMFDDDFGTDKMYRSFYDRPNVFRREFVYKTRGMQNRDREKCRPEKLILLFLIQVLPLLLIVLFASYAFFEPKYSLLKSHYYQIPKTTEKHGVEFFVKSVVAFDQRFPLGSPARANLEDTVFKDYKNMLWRYCHRELQRLHWAKNMPTPHCNKLHNLGVA